MYEDIGVRISVVAIFRNGGLFPHSFEWCQRTYLVQDVNFKHKQKLGESLVLYFSVLTKSNMYELSYNLNELSWKLERVWHE
jgi:hypothetical protein